MWGNRTIFTDWATAKEVGNELWVKIFLADRKIVCTFAAEMVCLRPESRAKWGINRERGEIPRQYPLL